MSHSPAAWLRHDHRNEVIGLAVVDSKPPGHIFRPDEIELIGRVTHQIGLDMHAPRTVQLDRQNATLQIEITTLRSLTKQPAGMQLQERIPCHHDTHSSPPERASMKNRFVVALVLLLAVAGMGNAGPVRAATTDGDTAAIRQVMDQAQAAWNRGDVVDFMHCYKDAPDTTFVGSSMQKGYQAVLASYRKAYANKAQMGQLTFSALDVRLLPNADGTVRYAIMTGHFHLDRNVHGTASKDDGVFSLVWEHTRDGWKIILDHSS